MPDPIDVSSGFDRADGSQGVGTAALAGQIIPASQTYFEEAPNSPIIERGEQTTFVHIYFCDPLTAFNVTTTVGRGTILTDSNGVITKVVTCRSDRQSADRMTLTVTAEYIGSTNPFIVLDFPPDEFHIEPFDISPDVSKHPRYFDLLTYNVDPTTGFALDANFSTGPEAINIIKDTIQSVTVRTRQDSLASLQISPSAPNVGYLQAAIKELEGLYHKGVETIYLPGVVVYWTQYFYYPPDLNPGGYLEDPVNGGLPPYFYQDINGNDIFIELIRQRVNPNMYDPTIANPITWIRLADGIEFSRTWFRITRAWKGSFIGNFDDNIYDAHAPLPGSNTPQ